MEELQKEIQQLKVKVAELERASIQLNIDPTTAIYLKNFITDNLPTQTYSTSAPSGAAPKGSIWCKYAGSPLLNEISSYDGTNWVPIK